jgi:hypothetical protein
LKMEVSWAITLFDEAEQEVHTRTHSPRTKNLPDSLEGLLLCVLVFIGFGEKRRRRR